MDREKIKTIGDLIGLIQSPEIPKNVISTGMGNMPNQIQTELAEFYRTAEAAAASTMSPTQTLDSELLGANSGRLDRLAKATAKGKEKARFTVKKEPVTKVATPTPRATPTATTVTLPGGTTIRPIGA